MKRVLLAVFVLSLVGGAYVLGQESQDGPKYYGEGKFKSITVMSPSGKDLLVLDGSGLTMYDSNGEKAAELSCTTIGRKFVLFDSEGKHEAISITIGDKNRRISMRSPEQSGILLHVEDKTVSIQGQVLRDPVQIVLPLPKK